MLAVGVSVLVTEGISGIDIAGSAQVTAGGDVLEHIGTLHGGAVGDVDDRSRSGSRRSVAYLTDVVLKPDVVACGRVATETELTGMIIDEQIVLLHVGDKEGVPRCKAVIDAHAVYLVRRLRAGQTCDGEIETVGMPPLTDSGVLHDHMIIERLQIIDEIGAVVPFAEVLCRHAVTTVHRGVADLQCVER